MTCHTDVKGGRGAAAQSLPGFGWLASGLNNKRRVPLATGRRAVARGDLVS